jgi:hypothetical protein
MRPGSIVMLHVWWGGSRLAPLLVLGDAVHAAVSRDARRPHDGRHLTGLEPALNRAGAWWRIHGGRCAVGDHLSLSARGAGRPNNRYLELTSASRFAIANSTEEPRVIHACAFAHRRSLIRGVGPTNVGTPANRRWAAIVVVALMSMSCSARRHLVPPEVDRPEGRTSVRILNEPRVGLIVVEIRLYA